MKKILNLISAAALAFAAIVAPLYADQLNVNAQTGTTYTFLNTDCGKLVTFSNASAVAATLPQAASASGGGGASGLFMPPCTISVINIGASVLTITPTTSTVGGNATLVLNTGQGATLVSDGANYQVMAGVAGLVNSNWLGNSTVATTMTSLGPTGSHTTVQEWLTFEDASGTVRYIPAY